jgi:CoA:oxalate CoA-transferase
MSKEAPSAAAPLAGVRVVDLSRVLAGPVAGRLFADLGADVIKVEPPDGDLSRRIASKADRGMSGLFTLANAGKRCISVDLRQSEGSALVLELVRASDLVIENYRPGVLDRLGLGWAAIQAANPRAVLVSINGFGAKSAWRDRGAYAPMMHALSGVLRYEAEWTGNPLVQIADNKADMSSGLHATIGALAALLAARETGRGQHVEVPLFDALLSSYSETAYVLMREPTHRDECRLFDAGSNGWIAIAGTPQNAWAVMKQHFGLGDGAGPGADVGTKARLRHAAMETWMQAQDGVDALLQRLEGAGLAAAPVQSLEAALRGPIAEERGLLVTVDDRRGGTREVVRAPYHFDGETCPVSRPAPRRGEHNGEVLAEVLGYAPARIRELAERGVLQWDPPESR